MLSIHIYVLNGKNGGDFGVIDRQESKEHGYESDETTCNAAKFKENLMHFIHPWAQLLLNTIPLLLPLGAINML